MHASALFADRHSAHAAVEQLAQAGFARDDLTVAMTEKTYEREFGPNAGRSSGVRPALYSAGVLAAIVAGLEAFSIAEGPRLRIAGPLLASVARTRSLSRALSDLAADEDAARAIHRDLREGYLLVGVHTRDERAPLAQQLLVLAGGEAPKAA